MASSSVKLTGLLEKHLKETQTAVLEECVELDSGDGRITYSWKPLPRTWSKEERLAYNLVMAAIGYKQRVKDDRGKEVIITVKPDLDIAMALVERFHGKPRQEIDQRNIGDTAATPSAAARELFKSLSAEVERQANERLHRATAPPPA